MRKYVLDRIQWNYLALFTLFVLAAISAGVALSSRGIYTSYNNYVIFKRSFFHLYHHTGLYVFYPRENYDLFKYTPTFAMLMGFFAYLPDLIGVPLFNVGSAVVFILALRRLKFNEHTLKLILLYVFIEMGITANSVQTNTVIAGLILFAFVFLEDDRPLWATLCIALSAYIKLFGLVGFSLLLLYPNKIKAFGYSLLWMVLLFLLPLLVAPPNYLFQQYADWFGLLRSDHEASYGISFIGLIHAFFGGRLPKGYFVLAGAFVFLLPFLRWKLYTAYPFRLQILASVLIWVIIFNHKGESPTYIVAMAGVAIWYFSQERNWVTTLLLWLCLVFTSFSSTDVITPAWIRDFYVEPFAIPALFPCIIWLLLIQRLLLIKAERVELGAPKNAQGIGVGFNLEVR